MRGDHRHEHERILEPLVQPQRLQIRPRTVLGGTQVASIGEAAFCPSRQTGWRINQDGRAAGFPYRQVGMVVANIVELACAKLRHEMISLARARKIAVRVASVIASELAHSRG